jgi:hypothetical protein
MMQRSKLQSVENKAKLVIVSPFFDFIRFDVNIHDSFEVA